MSLRNDSAQPITQKDLMAFSPVDMQIFMAGKPLLSILQISYQIHREVISLYGFGDPNPVGFNRGKRGIAGSLVCNTFQDHPLLRSSWAEDTEIYGKNNNSLSLKDAFGAGTGDKFKATLDDYAFSNGTFSLNTNPNFSGGTFSLSDQTLQQELKDSYDWVANRKLNYVDQLPPMDIVISCVNEMGAAAYMAINSVILINEAGMMSMESLSSETHFTFIARSITPLRAFRSSTQSSSNRSNNPITFSTNPSTTV
jgi:hypothetical protein